MKKYSRWHIIQITSSICYAVFTVLLLWMVYAELPYTLMVITAVLATASMGLTIISGLVRAFIGHKMGLKPARMDWLIAGIALLLVSVYLFLRAT